MTTQRTPMTLADCTEFERRALGLFRHLPVAGQRALLDRLIGRLKRTMADRSAGASAASADAN